MKISICRRHGGNIFMNGKNRLKIVIAVGSSLSRNSLYVSHQLRKKIVILAHFP